MRPLVPPLAIVLTVLLVCPTVAADTPPYAVEFPPDWTVEVVDEALEDGPARLLVRAYSADRSEACRVTDLAAVGAGLWDLGITEPDALSRAAADLLGHGGAYSHTSGLGYGDPWSMYMEGVDDGGAGRFAMYSFLGHDAWAGLEGAWLMLECSSAAPFHQDWAMIARTFGYEMPEAMKASTGPLVFGGRVELPEASLALMVPPDWVAADVADPGIFAALDGGGKAGEWFALQLEHGVGDAIEQQKEDGREVLLWTWAPGWEAGWPEHCELIGRESLWSSAAEMVELGEAYLDDDGPRETQTWSLIGTPDQSIARHDYDWSATSGGSDFHLIEPDRHLTLSCQDHAFDDAGDAAAKRQRWQTMAEALETLS